MIKDPIVKEIRQYRQEHAAIYGNNLDRIIEALRFKEQESKHNFINPGPKKILRKTG